MSANTFISSICFVIIAVFAAFVLGCLLVERSHYRVDKRSKTEVTLTFESLSTPDKTAVLDIATVVHAIYLRDGGEDTVETRQFSLDDAMRAYSAIESHLFHSSG
jgi:hypothetical protein